MSTPVATPASAYTFKGFKVLTKVVLIDVEAFRKVPAEHITATYELLNSHRKPLSFVASIAPMARSALRSKIIAGEDASILMEVFLGQPLTEEQSATISSIHKSLQALDELLKITKNAYQFADPPANFDILNTVIIGKQSINRNGYSIGHKTLEKLWEKAKTLWLDPDSKYNQYNTFTVQASGFGRDTVIFKDSIKVGCQTIQRYELEALASHFNWSFTPTV